MFTLYLVPMRTHTCDSWGFQVGIKSKRWQSKSMRRRKDTSFCWCATQWQQQALLETGGKKASSCTLAPQDIRRGTPGIKNDTSCWNVQGIQCLGGSGIWQWMGTAIIAAGSLIKVQMPSEEFLQKNSPVIAMYQSCLGYSFSKYSLLHNEK